MLAKKGYRGGPADIWSLGARGSGAAAPLPVAQLRAADGCTAAACRTPAAGCSRSPPPTGVVLYAMLAGCLPFDEDALPALFAKISAADYAVPPWLSDDAAALLDAMLRPDPEQRWVGGRSGGRAGGQAGGSWRRGLWRRGCR